MQNKDALDNNFAGINIPLDVWLIIEQIHFVEIVRGY